jgi:hypothetical protein
MMKLIATGKQSVGPTIRPTQPKIRIVLHMLDANMLGSRALAVTP